MQKRHMSIRAIIGKQIDNEYQKNDPYSVIFLSNDQAVSTVADAFNLL